MKKGQNQQQIATHYENYIEPKISIEECKTILTKNGENYTDEEVKEIRDFLFILVKIDYFLFQEHVKKEAEETKIINLNSDKNEKESDNIHENGLRIAS